MQPGCVASGLGRCRAPGTRGIGTGSKLDGVAVDRRGDIVAVLAGNRGPSCFSRVGGWRTWRQSRRRAQDEGPLGDVKCSVMYRVACPLGLELVLRTRDEKQVRRVYPEHWRRRRRRPPDADKALRGRFLQDAGLGCRVLTRLLRTTQS